jgi:acyl-CoA reductase-like NAD-dependent aldehyde dehydrogenase
MGEQKDVDAAVASSRAALPGWSQKAPAERASVLLKFADLLEREAEAIGELEAVCGVKPLNIFHDIELPLAARAFRCRSFPRTLFKEILTTMQTLLAGVTRYPASPSPSAMASTR